jgi:hypothetical protein
MLEEKVETLTKEIVKLRQAIEAGGTVGADKAAPKKAKPAAEDEDDAPVKKKAPAKKKAVEPEHDEDETGALFRKAAKKDKPACKAYLKKVKVADLAELLTKPELFDAAYDFAEALLEADDDDDDDDDDEV